MTAFTLRWTSLRNLGSSNIARLSILVPIIGYWIIFNGKLVVFLTLAQEFVSTGSIDNAAHVPWQLFWTYYGLFFIGAATGIYQVRCPLEIKKYDSTTEYVTDAFEVIGNTDFLKFMDTIEKGDEESRYRASKIFGYTSARNAIGGPAGSTTVNMREFKTDIMTIYFDFLNRSDAWWRSLIGVLYIIGFGCLLVPTGFILWRVTKLLL